METVVISECIMYVTAEHNIRHSTEYRKLVITYYLNILYSAK